MGRTKAKSTRLALESGRKATSTPLDPHVIQWAATEQTNLLHARRALSTKHGKGEEDWEPVEPGFDEKDWETVIDPGNFPQFLGENGWDLAADYDFASPKPRAQGVWTYADALRSANKPFREFRRRSSAPPPNVSHRLHAQTEVPIKVRRACKPRQPREIEERLPRWGEVDFHAY